MSLSDKLSHIEYLQVTDRHFNKSFCGSDQEWFSDERQRLTGCAPSAAASILFYLSRKENPACCGRNSKDLICDEGITKLIDLKLWLESTIGGGGFVYFRDMDNKVKEFIYHEHN